MSLLQPLRSRLQETVSGQSDGVPAYITAFEKGDDAGFFGPGSAVWAVHGGMPTLVAGVRALLMQALHPGALAGVWDWSRFREDPLGRLANTVRWIFTVTYGTTQQATAGSDWVLRLHERVRGEYVDGRGIRRPYAANDADLATWVHLAFTDAFLESHVRWGGAIPGGPDAYVREWATAGELMHVPDPPRTVVELKAAMRRYADDGLLRRDERVDEVVRFLRDAPLRRALKPSYRILFAGAVSSLESPYRELLAIREPGIGPIDVPLHRATGAALAGAELLLGEQTAGEKAARRRIARLDAAARRAGA